MEEMLYRTIVVVQAPYRSGSSDHREWSTYWLGCSRVFFSVFAILQEGDSFERCTVIYEARVTVHYSTRDTRVI